MQLNNRNPNITITSSKALGVIRSSGHNVTTKAVYCLTSLSYVRRPCLPISRYSSTNRIHKVRIFHRYIISFLLPEKQIYPQYLLVLCCTIKTHVLVKRFCVWIYFRPQAVNFVSDLFRFLLFCFSIEKHLLIRLF